MPPKTRAVNRARAHWDGHEARRQGAGSRGHWHPAGSLRPQVSKLPSKKSHTGYPAPQSHQERAGLWSRSPRGSLQKAQDSHVAPPSCQPGRSPGLHQSTPGVPSPAPRHPVQPGGGRLAGTRSWLDFTEACTGKRPKCHRRDNSNNPWRTSHSARRLQRSARGCRCSGPGLREWKHPEHQTLGVLRGSAVKPQLASMRTRVRSLASVSGLRI